MEWEAKYSGPGKSGRCVCGHGYQCHHLGMVVRQDYFDATGEAYVPQECEFYGHNECGGLDDNGEAHCFGYEDDGKPEAKL